MYRRRAVPALVVCFTALVMTAAVLADASGGRVSVPVEVKGVQVNEGAFGIRVEADDFGSLLVPGKPQLPSKILPIALPPGAEVLSVTCDINEQVELDGHYDVAPAALPRVIGEEDPLLYAERVFEYEENRSSVYESDDSYPQEVVEQIRRAGYRRYQLVDVRVTPFSYKPKSGRLIYYPRLTVHVDYRVTKGVTVSADTTRAEERVARRLIANYGDAGEWYASRYRDSKGLHDLVIITTSSLTSAVSQLVDWEEVKGRNVEVVTTSWINSNYSGYDLAERIRNFLRDKYPSNQWGIEDVLLVGDYDDVPMRRTYQDVGYGQPETDYYYAELSLPDNQSWDADGDHRYGEYSDPIDFYSEVNVGRIPWSNSATVASICSKSVAYENHSDPAYKKNVLLLGAYFWDNTDNAVLMESLTGLPLLTDWTFTRAYEKNDDYWSSYSCDFPLTSGNVISNWSNTPYAYVTWAGHGTATSSHLLGRYEEAFVTSNTCNYLNDDYPAIIFADACSNSDTDRLNIGQSMLRRGAVGFLGATKVAMGHPAWSGPNDGSSQSLDYFFTAYTTGGEYTQGQAHQAALRHMYVYGLWDNTRYEMFEWGALWGSPTLGMAFNGDCNQNGVLDSEDIANGVCEDCNANGIPDECELGSKDCNNNQVLDECEIDSETAQDCNGNLIPDECDIDSGEAEDCNNNQIPDSCDRAELIPSSGQPINVNACSNGVAVFSVSLGSSTVAYQWYRDSAPGLIGDVPGRIDGATSPELTISSLTSADEGDYWCEVILDGCIVSQSHHVSLTLTKAPRITEISNGAVTCELMSITFNVDHEGKGEFDYDYIWRKDGEMLQRQPGSSVLTINQTTLQDAGVYTCEVIDGACGRSEISGGMVLDVIGAEFVKQPMPQCLATDDTAVFEAQAQTTHSIEGYRWQKWTYVPSRETWMWIDVMSPAVGSELPPLVVSAPLEDGRYRGGVYVDNACWSYTRTVDLHIGSGRSDMDGDNDVDMADMQLFTSCFGGELDNASECGCADLANVDSAVDLEDWVIMAGEVTGPEQ